MNGAVPIATVEVNEFADTVPVTANTLVDLSKVRFAEAPKSPASLKKTCVLLPEMVGKT